MIPFSGLKVADIAPDFTLHSASGQRVNLYEQLQRSHVVLFFFLKAFTPVCVAEACSFRESFSEIRAEGAALFGVSSDSEKLARLFASKFHLPYPLLIDAGGAVRKLYGVPKLLGLLEGRSTYVIAPDRRVAHVIHSQLGSRQHVLTSLESLRRL